MPNILALSLFLFCNLLFATIPPRTKPCTNAVEACRQIFEVGGPHTFIHLFATRDLSSFSGETKRAIIVVHGMLRDADEYFNSMVQVVKNAGDIDSTLVIAPYFADREHSEPGESSWDNWKAGDDSLVETRDSGKGSGAVSSFEVMDRLLTRLSDRSHFPQLSHVVVVGHSAGGQYTHRYAATSRLDELNLPYQLRYVVANPSSYLYLDTKRPIAGSLDHFAIPPASECPGFNLYMYGLSDRNRYASLTASEQISGNLLRRPIVYLLGQDDILSEDLDMSCEAMLEGPNRLSRGLAFFNYIQQLAEEGNYPHSWLLLVPGVGHDHLRMFDSPEGRMALLAPAL